VIEIIIETVIGTIALVVIAFLSYRVLSLKKLSNQLTMSFLEASMEKDVALEKLSKTLQTINNTNLEDKDGFIKFLSQSREWAFEYIENVQYAIKELSTAMDSSDEKQILEAYNQIMKYMPEETINN
jgi:hypothetical protein